MLSVQQVLASLDAVAGCAARDIATRLGCKKTDVNSLLYRMIRTGKVRQEGLLWFLVKPSPKGVTTKAAAPATQLPQPASSIKEKVGNSPSSAKAALMTNPKEIIWTTEQSVIINAPVSERVLVEAGPGTGKTAVACARVAKLLSDDDITPSSILMVSFTRTAVAEMKNRIRLWAESGKVSGVNIATLDQTAFTFGTGCGQQFEKLMGSFEDNIRNTLDHFTKKNALLLDYVRGLDHIIIDEAQDLIGSRAELASHLIGALRPDAGATIFADACQAIYGFTTDVDVSSQRAQHFLQSFPAREKGFKSAQLRQIHRAANLQILNLFTEARQTLTGVHTADVAHVAQVIKSVEDAAQSEGSNIESLSLEDGDLLLYRKRASALMHAAFCPNLFRLRLPSHPPALFPWLGLVFSEFSDPLISKTEFDVRWNTNVSVDTNDGFTPDRAWELLHRFAGKRNDLSVNRLRALLSRPRPQVEFCQLDYGGFGPIFSTIHASKGREADRVFLMLPRNLKYLEGNTGVDLEEEAKVFYVGATRVRKQFLRGEAHSLKMSQRLNRSSERVIQLCGEDKLKFQVGLAHDFDDLAPISRETFHCQNASAASAHQQHLIELWQKCVAGGTAAKVTAVAQPASGSKNWPYQFKDDEQRLLAWSADVLGKDLWSMNGLVEKKHGGHRHPPKYLHHLRMIGLRTRVLAEDDPAALGRIHKPFADSGFWLAPMIVGFPSLKFPTRH